MKTRKTNQNLMDGGGGEGVEEDSMKSCCAFSN